MVYLVDVKILMDGYSHPVPSYIGAVFNPTDRIWYTPIYPSNKNLDTQKIDTLELIPNKGRKRTFLFKLKDQQIPEPKQEDILRCLSIADLRGKDVYLDSYSDFLTLCKRNKEKGYMFSIFLF